MKRKFGETTSDEALGDLDYQAKAAAIRRDPSKTRILIGDRFTWVTACSWVISERRCRMAASLMGYCAWHSWAAERLRGEKCK